MQEIAVLKAMMDRTLYLTYSPMLRKLKNLSKVHSTMLKVYDYIFSNTENSKERLTEGEIRLTIDNHYSHMKEDLNDLLNQIVCAEIDQTLINETINNIVERHFCSEIITIGLPVVEGQKYGVMNEIENIVELYKDHLLVKSEEEIDLSSVPIVNIFEKQNIGVLKWPLVEFNNIFGPLSIGRLGHIFAYSEVGKTALGITLATYFAKQLRESNKNIVYCGNEEDYEITYGRAVACFTSTPLRHLKHDPLLAEEKYSYYIKNGGLRIRYVDGVHHVIKVRQVIERYKPVVLFIDQGAKVTPYGVSTLTTVDAKQKIFQSYRELAKKHKCTIISLGQGDATTEGKKWLYLNQMDGSKVGIPGELDFAIGIGCDNQDSRRYINVVKNKLGGVHRQFTCGFDYERSLYYD